MNTYQKQKLHKLSITYKSIQKTIPSQKRSSGKGLYLSRATDRTELAKFTKFAVPLSSCVSIHSTGSGFAFDCWRSCFFFFFFYLQKNDCIVRLITCMYVFTGWLFSFTNLIYLLYSQVSSIYCYICITLILIFSAIVASKTKIYVFYRTTQNIYKTLFCEEILQNITTSILKRIKKGRCGNSAHYLEYTSKRKSFPVTHLS